MKPVSSKRKEELRSATNGHCAYCGAVLPQDPSQWVGEHKLSRSRGGVNHVANLAPACGACNRKKRTSTLPEFKAKIKNRACANLEDTLKLLEAYYHGMPSSDYTELYFLLRSAQEKLRGAEPQFAHESLLGE